MRIAYSTRLLGSCKFTFNFDRNYTSSLRGVQSPPVSLLDCFTKLKPTRHHDNKAPSIPKIAVEDTTLTVNNADGGKTTVPIVAGTELNLHVPGLHHNRTLNSILSWRPALMEFHSAVLEGASQVHAREISG